jgi:diguanylate cyclase (GGDEF)-like protein
VDASNVILYTESLIMIIVLIIHYLLITGAAALGVSGLANGVGEGYAVPEFTGAVIPALLIGLILWKAIRAPSKKVGVHYFLWASVLALLMRSVFPSGQEEVYTALLFTCAVLPAVVRPGGAWVAVFLVTALLYGAQVAVEGKVWVEEATRDSVWYMGVVEFACFSLVGGLVPWWVLSRRAQAQEQEFHRTLEEVRNNAISDAMARTRSKSILETKKKPSEQAPTAAIAATSTLSTAALSAGTMRIDGGASSSDTFSLLNAGGEEVNEKLKAMLFFMRYNFKGLTACAYIYDPSKRMLALNCYDTKNDIQIKDDVKIPFGAGVIGQVVSENRLFMSGDLSLYQKEDTCYVKDEGVASIIAVPIAAEGSKEILGVLAVDSTNKNAFTEHDKELMRRFSIIAAALIINIRMSLTLEQSAKTFRMFYEASHNFSIALKMEEIFNVLVGMVPKIVPSCGRLIVILHDQGKNALRFHIVAGNKGELSEGMEFPPTSGGIYSYAFNKTTPVNIPDLQTQKRNYRFVPDEPKNTTTRSLLIIPIIGGEERKCIGLFSAESAVPDLFKPEIEQILTTIIENASVAITRSLLYLKMEKLATTDGLTGLNNHRTFQEVMARELERAKRYARPLSLLLTDIDHFKSFNDTYGHPVGDLVLREIAGCIRSALRVSDIPARYGGEEFAVVLPETDEQGGMITAEKIRQTVENRIIESGTNKLRVTISIGCVTYPTYGTTQQEIIDCSDKALYASKKGGRNRVTMYNPTMTVASK